MESVTGPDRLERVKKMRDFAFVHFTDRESAKAAMDYWHRKLCMAVLSPVHHFDLCFVCVIYLKKFILCGHIIWTGMFSMLQCCVKFVGWYCVDLSLRLCQICWL